ncbi:MAG: hypothetical protein LBS23_02335 [Holosporaceae bacterium]|jgi:hypothetical protein|nr:hypothetical protein [Holosporaceae bacterium]
MKTLISYFPNQNYTPPGEYEKTALDLRKEKADFLLQAIDGSRYSIYAKTFMLPDSRGVKNYKNGNYAVTKCVLEQLKKQYTWECDF